jgi:hypothetical protein
MHVTNIRGLIDGNWELEPQWGLPAEAVDELSDDLQCFWQHCRPCFRTRTRDQSEHGYDYLMCHCQSAERVEIVERYLMNQLTGG